MERIFSRRQQETRHNGVQTDYTMIDQYDKREGYCKILGHFLTFDYCRSSNDGLPCSKVLDCWFQQFKIQDFILANYSEEDRKRMFEPVKPKILSLSEILDQAQKRLKKPLTES